MIRSVIILITLIHASLVYGQEAFTPVRDTAAFRKNFQTAAAALSSVKSDFVQDKNLSLVTEKISSRGKFLYKKANKVRMEYTDPFQYLLIINGNKILIREGGKTTTFSSGSNKLFEQISRVMVDCVQGNVMSNPDFKVSVSESNDSYLLSMKPLNKELNSLFTSIKILADKKNYSVKSIDLIEVSGDNTLINFKNRQLNVEIPDAEFSVK